MKRWISLFAGVVLGLGARAADPSTTVDSAVALWRSGKTNEALAGIAGGLTEHPGNARLLSVRAQMHLMGGKPDLADADLTSAIAAEPDSGWLRQERGQLRFRQGRIEDSVADFDKAIELTPRMFPHNWQRGIALYYAGRFGDGRKQFEAHQQVNTQDVENAAWHFLCLAREQGIEAARARLIPISGDTRIPMKEVQQLFGGKATPAEVLRVASVADVESDRKEQQFYAHLYLGLYFEATGDKAKRDEHIQEASRLADPRNYMGAVARVHALRLKASASAPSVPPVPSAPISPNK